MKKALITGVSLLIHFCSTVQAQDFKVFRQDQKYGLKNADGKITIDAIYDKLGWSDGLLDFSTTVIGYYDQGNWGLISMKGKIISEPIFSSLNPIDKERIVASKADTGTEITSYGIINTKGKTIIDFKYQWIRPFTERLLVVVNKAGQKGIIDKKGEQILPCRFYSIGPFVNGKCKVYQGGKLGVIDSLGNIILQTDHKSISKDLSTSPFSKIEIRTNKNDLVKTFFADSVFLFQNQSTAVYRNGFLEILNGEFKVVAHREDVIDIHESGANLLLYTEEGVHIIKGDGTPLTPVMYDDANAGQIDVHSSHLIAVKKGANWGYISSSGENTIPFDFQSATPFIADIAKIKKGRHTYLINQTGRRIGVLDYDSIAIQANNTAVGKVRERTDLLDASGAVLFDISGDLQNHSLGFITKDENGILGLINEYGEIIFNSVHKKISEVINNQFMVVKTSSRLGLTHLDGTWSYWLTGDYQDMEAVTDDMIGIQRDNKWGFINYNKQLIIANRYDTIRCFQNEMAAVSLNGHWGFINRREQIVVQPNLEEIGKFYEGLAIVKRQTRYGVINSLGNMDINIEYDRLTRLEDGRYLAVKDNKIGLINKKGNQIIPISFNKLFPKTDGNFVANRRGKYGLINHNGKFVIPLKFKRVELVANGNYICEYLSDEQLN